jgi:hypothetical protein
MIIFTTDLQGIRRIDFPSREVLEAPKSSDLSRVCKGFEAFGKGFADRPFNSSTLPFVKPSTIQPFNPSIRQALNHSTLPFVKPSTIQLFNPSIRQALNHSTLQPFHLSNSAIQPASQPASCPDKQAANQPKAC